MDKVVVDVIVAETSHVIVKDVFEIWQNGSMVGIIGREGTFIQDILLLIKLYD